MECHHHHALTNFGFLFLYKRFDNIRQRIENTDNDHECKGKADIGPKLILNVLWVWKGHYSSGRNRRSKRIWPAGVALQTGPLETKRL